jgi:hypothetical protein
MKKAFGIQMVWYFALKREVNSLKIAIGESMAIVKGILSRVDMRT